MPSYQIDGVTPVVSLDSYVHPTAVLIGDVIIETGVYIGPNASLRGDFGRIVVKRGANIQDNCVMHGFPEQDTVVEEDGHIGHCAVLHGCVIRRNAMVGMNAVIMDAAEIGENCIVGAASFVKAGASYAANQLILGAPAKVVRTLSSQELAWKRAGTEQYHQLVTRSQQSLREVEPLRDLDADHPRISFTDPHQCLAEARKAK
ncbi:phenylacetic acid degradation protein PaaY [Rosenbergiella epipactidis]|uniref:phenylacetic acid degradation protein PaaY n=1 Tax=Rosenbergiella epipactidis TaxID=1544694 RepID=UPI001BDB5B9A|nr:phenylacetic acid degradation protein PaaY [Rosenbergiella epipactidis]MBT0718552.1 phenylacetic acid degradation protein PaaY [Rosenbergiella epipactidis]